MKKLAVICATDTELEPFLRHIENKKISQKARLTVYEGTIGTLAVVALYSGVCKVNAAIATQIVIDGFGVDAVVNAGSAGGMAAHVGLLDTVISTEVAYHDVADDILTAFHPWLPQPSFPADQALLTLARQALGKRPDVLFGRMVTGEQFITDRKRAAILQKSVPLSVDMETAAVAHVCYASGVPFLAVRSITDTADGQSAVEFERNCLRAAEQAKEVVLALLGAMEAQ